MRFEQVVDDFFIFSYVFNSDIRTQKANIEILLSPWTRRQMSPSCREPLKVLMAENESIPSGEARSHRHAAFIQVNQQFNKSKLGRHSSTSETRLVTRTTKRKSLGMTQTFTMD